MAEPSTPPTVRPPGRRWYRSLYWRIALGFIFLLALMLGVQAASFVWIAVQTEGGVPEPTLREHCRFAGLEWTPAFARVVAKTEFYDSTKTWRKHLTDAEGDRVLEFMQRTDRVTA